MGASLERPGPVDATFTLKATAVPLNGEGARDSNEDGATAPPQPPVSRFVLLQHSFTAEAPDWGVAQLLRAGEAAEMGLGPGGRGRLELEVTVSEGRLLSNLPGWEGGGGGGAAGAAAGARPRLPLRLHLPCPPPPPPRTPRLGGDPCPCGSSCLRLLGS